MMQESRGFEPLEEGVWWIVSFSVFIFLKHLNFVLRYHSYNICRVMRSGSGGGNGIHINQFEEAPQLDLVLRID